MLLTDPVGSVKGIGPQRLSLLTAHGIKTVGDLLNKFPASYEDSTHIYTLSEMLDKARRLPVWESLVEKYAVKAKIKDISTFRTNRGLTICKCQLYDEETQNRFTAVWFNQPFIVKLLKEEEWFFFFGKLKIEGSKLQFQSPKFELVTGAVGKTIGHVLPVYRRIKSIRSATFRQWTQVINQDVQLFEYVPDDLLNSYHLQPINVSYKMVHHPKDITETELGYRRVAMQELCELRTRYEKKHRIEKAGIGGVPLGMRLSQYVGNAIKQLPFTLTASQQNAVKTLIESIAEGRRLDTFIYGDVGSGKTIVVLLVAGALISCGYSAMLAAPTSILAEQHVKTAQKLLGKILPAEAIEIITGKSTKKVLDASIPTLFVGTHALLYRDFLAREKIALTIVDEQHRFGVAQRQQLAQQEHTHTVTLSATPIPRTLALSFLGFSDAIELKDKPVGRKQVITKLVPSGKEEVTYQWILKHIEQGERVYMVFPRIEDEEQGEKQSLLAMSEFLKQVHFSSVKSAILYGGMKEDEKADIMQQFADGKIQLLFSTTVIEVGVDVPEATVIAVHGAENFGLAQLHQLRGRVGRSDQQSYCFLFTEELTEEQEQRLIFFSEHTDGLSVSEYDLKHRGSGTILGEVQAGESELKVASLDDLSLIQDAMNLYGELKQRKVKIEKIVS